MRSPFRLVSEQGAILRARSCDAQLLRRKSLQPHRQTCPPHTSLVSQLHAKARSSGGTRLLVGAPRKRRTEHLCRPHKRLCKVVTASLAACRAEKRRVAVAPRGLVVCRRGGWGAEAEQTAAEEGEIEEEAGAA